MAEASSEHTRRQIRQSTILSRVTAGVVGALLIVFFLTTVGNTTTVLSRMEMVKSDQYPASVAAGHLETRLVQLRTVATQSVYANSGEAADEMLRINAEVEAEIWQMIDTLAGSTAVDPDDVRALRNGYAELNLHLSTLAEMVRDPAVTAPQIGTYVNEHVYPLMVGLLDADRSALDQTTNAVNDVYTAVNDACRQTIFVSWILIIAVIIALFVYLAILHRKTRREEHLTSELRHALDLAQSASRAKSTFLSSMSHDIRTPMNAIAGLTTIARSNLDDTARVESCLDRIATSSQHLMSLVNDVLDMSEIENGRIALSEDAIDLDRMLDDLEGMMQSQARAKDLDLVVKVGPLAHRIVRGDGVRLQQVLLNLVSNAVKYTNPGGWVRVQLTEEPAAEAGAADYRLVVEDNGIGMEPDFLRDIFKPFERERNETTPFTEGAGLGMTITKNVVDLMGGTIDVESRPGLGSKFTVVLPLTITQDNPDAGPAAADDDAPLSGRVLLVEDDELNREIALELIQSLGVDVETAVDGVDAVETITAAEPGRYGLIFMDFQMPRMGGMEATEKIIALERAQGWPHTPIVAMTANAFNEDRKRATDAGMDGFISKPINVSQLKRYLRQFLREPANESKRS